ncbi:MAG: glycosyl hydrolase 53 family protein [Bacteroidales bacterium]|nr:glycosyl hydrolase 53 family protein [Bacteroidales bacterium]
MRSGGPARKGPCFWFDNMIARGVKFDVVGLSYYPRYFDTWMT